MPQSLLMAMGQDAPATFKRLEAPFTVLASGEEDVVAV